MFKPKLDITKIITSSDLFPVWRMKPLNWETSSVLSKKKNWPRCGRQFPNRLLHVSNVPYWLIEVRGLSLIWIIKVSLENPGPAATSMHLSQRAAPSGPCSVRRGRRLIGSLLSHVLLLITRRSMLTSERENNYILTLTAPPGYQSSHRAACPRWILLRYQENDSCGFFNRTISAPAPSHWKTLQTVPAACGAAVRDVTRSSINFHVPVTQIFKFDPWEKKLLFFVSSYFSLNSKVVLSSRANEILVGGSAAQGQGRVRQVRWRLFTDWGREAVKRNQTSLILLVNELNLLKHQFTSNTFSLWCIGLTLLVL